MADTIRDFKGRFSKKAENKLTLPDNTEVSIARDHCYNTQCVCDSEICTDVFINDNWKKGRRIIELNVLLSNLRYCKECRLGPVPLTINNIVGELKKGLSGYLYVQCLNEDCRFVNCVPYGKTHHVKERGMPCFAVNTKLGTAMIDSAGGANRVNNFLSTLNIQPMSNPSLKKMERRAGVYVEQLSKESCSKAAQETFKQEMKDISQLESKEAETKMENLIPDLGVAILPDSSPQIKKLLQQEKDHCTVNEEDQWTDDEQKMPLTINRTKNRNRQIIYNPESKVKARLNYPCKERTGMTCAVDTAWQKKGFDSLTSHTFFMGKAKYGKKVLKSVISHRTCGTCKWWKRNRPEKEIPSHRCVHDHTGSARLMESASGEKGVKALQEEGTPVEVIEGDGDNTLISRLKKNLNIDMKKKFDKNHVVKNITSTLYALHNKKTVKLSKTVILHLQKCLKYAFSKNAGNSAAMKENLIAIVPHQFGDHSLCFPRFCGYKRRPGEKYVHRSLPYKCALKDHELQAELAKVFAPIIINHEQYCDLGSSQQCEHANREVSLRAPKSLHYGNSESLDFRVHATAAFINEGRNYITKVHSAAGLSPGDHTVSYAEKCAKQRKRICNRSQLPSTKRRRLELKQERVIYKGAQEVLEGVSYQTGIGYQSDNDISRLPEAVPRGSFKPVCCPGGDPTMIVFDLETTDLIRGHEYPHITQIAAWNPHSDKSFDQYVLPKVPISQNAQQITGISLYGNKLYHRNTEVHTSSITNMLFDFCVWLKQFKNVFLIAHNGKRFDFPVLISALQSIDSQQKFFSCVLGCVDTLPLFKNLFPGRSSYKQEDLVKDILHSSYGAHNAVEDVKALGQLTIQACGSPTNKKFMDFSFSPNCVFHAKLFNEAKMKNLPSLNVLIASGICKRTTAENIAGSGLGLNHLKLIYEREGEDGLRNTFIVKNNQGQPRVTNTPRILESVIPKLCDYFKDK